GWSSGYSNSGTRPTAVPSAAAPPTITASPTAIASCWNWVPAGSPRTSPGTGSATRIGGAPPGGPAAARTVCSSDTAAASCRSGQGRPVRPAATASYAVTEWLGAHTLSASSTSSGAAAPANQELAHTDREALGHHMMFEV